MPAREYSPFTPGQPVPLEFFVGRVAEVDRLRSAVSATANGRLRVAFLTGERGIGKSSLASFVRFLGERDDQVVGLHTFLGGVSSLEEMVRRVFDRLLKESIGKTWQGQVADFFGDHVRKVGLFGVTLEFGAAEKDLARLVYDFVPSMRRLVEQLKEQARGILLILDDINGLASSEAFANWVKSLVDEIATSHAPLPLCLVLVGLEERRQSLIRCQPSLVRVFDVVEIRPWSSDETRTFFENAFTSVDIKTETPATETLVRYAGGLPVLAHEIGDATFRVDQDGVVDLHDAIRGLLEAAEIVGHKYVEPQVLRLIRSERYRAILKKLSKKPGFPPLFSRGDLKEILSGEEYKVLDNFLRRMRELGVVRSEPERGPGAYRFENLLHLLYISMATSLPTPANLG
jgi:hypothetical protein